MKKSILVFLAIFYCSSVLSAEIEKMENDAAKRASCNKNNPCYVNTRGHKDTYVVKVTSASINENGVINVNHYQFKRFLYNGRGELIPDENNGK